MIEITRHFISLGAHLRIVISAYYASFTFFVFTVALFYIHVVLRAIMDIKYDLAGEPTKAGKIKLFLKLQVINIFQFRRVYDNIGIILHGGFSMSLLMTRVVECLCKLVPQTMLAFLTLMLSLQNVPGQEYQYTDFAASLVAIILAVYDYQKVMSNFECSMNPKSQAVKTWIKAYFSCDVFCRCSAFGFTVYTFGYLTEKWTGAFISILVSYLLRCFLMMLIFFMRGYVYPPEPGQTVNASATATYKFFFSFFPGGYIQVHTDFPFNGDLSSKWWVFILQQIFSVVEVFVLVLLSSIEMDQYNSHTPAVLWIFTRVLPVLALGLKCYIFPKYYGAKVTFAKKVEMKDGTTKTVEAEHQSKKMLKKVESRSQSVRKSMATRKSMGAGVVHPVEKK